MRNWSSRRKNCNKPWIILREAQTQLVQSEKLASIGQLTAGIAHEINNPVNYINAGIDSLKTNVKEIGHILDLYRSITKENFDEQFAILFVPKKRRLTSMKQGVRSAKSDKKCE